MMTHIYFLHFKSTKIYINKFNKILYTENIFKLDQEDQY